MKKELSQLERDYITKMQEKFTIEEIKNYIDSQDSFGDVAYNLSAENIIKANEPKEPVDESAYGKRDVRFPDTEDMHCPGKCQEPTRHSLQPDKDIPEFEASKSQKKWTCLDCGHQL